MRKKFQRICALVVVGMFAAMALSTSVPAGGPNDPWLMGGNTADSDDFLGTNNDEDLRFKTYASMNAAPRMIIKNTGEVGIGTISPQEELTLGPDSNFATEMDVPTGVSATATTGGSLSAGYYNIRVVASDGVGTTIGSLEDGASVDGITTNAVNVVWTAPQGASSFRIYVGKDGAQDRYHIDTASPFLLTAYGVGDGSTLGTVPTVTTAYVNKITASGNSWFLGGNIGIGMASPSSDLEVDGNVELTNLYDNDGSNFFDGGATASQTVTGITSTGALQTTAISISESQVTGEIESVTAGSGLTGGGASGDVTLDVGAGDGIQVNADSIEVKLDGSTLAKSASGLKVAAGGITATELNSAVAGDGLTGGGGSPLAVSAGNGIEIVSDNVEVKLDGSTLAKSASGLKVAAGGITATELNSAVAGDGLTGGGGSPLAVSAGNGIEIVSDNVEVKLDGSTLAKSASGLKVATSGITETEIATSVAGAGLTGGGGSALDVGAGDDITVNVDDVALSNDIDVTNILAATSSGLSLKDDGSTLGIFIGDGGNVGIGMDGPNEMLDVAGNVHASSSFIAGSTTTYGDGFITLSAGTDLNINSNTLYIDNTNDRVGIGVATPSALLDIDRPDTSSNADLIDFKVTGFTQTISTDITSLQYNWFGQSTITAATSQTVGKAATVYIDGAPVAAGSASITNSYALWVESGSAMFGGDVRIGSYTSDHKVLIEDSSTDADRAALYVEQYGAQTGETGYGIYVKKIGASDKNVAGYFYASGGTENYALQAQGTMILDQKIMAGDAGGLEFAADDGYTRIYMDDDGNVGIGYLTNDLHQTLVVNGNVGIGYNDDSQTAKLAVNGNVGIKDYDPDAELTVVGTIRAATSSSENYYIEMNTDGIDGYINFKPTTGTNDLYFQYDGTTEMVLEDSGDLGINTDEANGPLDIAGSYIIIRNPNSVTQEMTGYTGQICWTSTHIYVCISGGETGTWRRVALSDFD